MEASKTLGEQSRSYCSLLIECAVCTPYCTQIRNF